MSDCQPDPSHVQLAPDPLTSLDIYNYYFEDTNGVIMAQVIPGGDDRSVILITEQPLSPSLSYTDVCVLLLRTGLRELLGRRPLIPITFDTTAPAVSLQRWGGSALPV